MSIHAVNCVTDKYNHIICMCLDSISNHLTQSSSSHHKSENDIIILKYIIRLWIRRVDAQIINPLAKMSDGLSNQVLVNSSSVSDIFLLLVPFMCFDYSQCNWRQFTYL